jgi:predicted PurR-regulated permease PerM
LAENEQLETADTAESSRWRILHYIFLLALCLLTGWLVYWIVKPFLRPIITAILLAIVYYPIHLRWARTIRYPGLAALASTMTVFLTLIVPFVLLGIAVERELADLYRQLSAQSAQDGGWGPWLSHTSERFSNWLRGFVDVPPFDLQAILLEQLRRASVTAVDDVAALLGNMVTFVVDGVISFFTLFFVFRDGSEIYARVEGVVPLRPGQVERLRVEIGRTITASVYGGLAVAIAQGSLTGLAFLVLGIPSPAVWGMASALFSFVPLVGPALVWGPAAVMLFIGGHWVKGLIMIAWGAGVIGLADNIVRPYVISEQVRFYPLAIFIALLGGAQAFGLLGLFIGPIVLAVAQALLRLIREENQLRQLGY